MDVRPWRRQRGDAAETACANWLSAQGLRLICRNWRSRMGEIDLVMRDGSTVVFIEVRFRSSSDHGGAVASVHQHKQRRLVAAARHYLARRPQHAACPCRFDVVAMTRDEQGEFAFDWIQSAFYGD